MKSFEFSSLMASFGGRNAALIIIGKMSMAEAFDAVHGCTTENNGWYGRSLSRHPLPNEAKELFGEYFSSMWAWEFPDGSCLYLTPGLTNTTVTTA